MRGQNQIAITGGTGHLGHSIIVKLLQEGNSVKALYRSSKPSLEHENLTWIQGDVNDYTAVDLCTQNVSFMIHCASIITIGNYSEKEVYHVNVNGTKRVVEACLKNKVRLIYVSSSAAVKETLDDEVFNENRPFKTQKDFCYDWTKSISEQFILKAVKGDNLDAIIIRPTAIVGPPDHRPSYFGQTILDLTTSKAPLIINGGYNIVDVRDVSQTIINSIDLGVSGEVYLVSGAYVSLKQLALLINPGRRYFTLSLSVLIMLLPIIKIYKRIFPLKWHISKESLITLKRAPKNMDASKAIEKLNHQIRPIENTINDVLSWFKKEKLNGFR